MFDKRLIENYIRQPYIRKLEGDILAEIQEKLNSRGRIAAISTVQTRDFEAREAFRKRGYSSYSKEILDSEALMISNGRPVELSFFKAVNVDVDGIIMPSTYSLAANPHYAVLKYFSGSDEKDIAFVRRCLKECRFNRVQEK